MGKKDKVFEFEYEKLKEVIKQANLSALFEYKEYERRKKRSGDQDKIALSVAYRVAKSKKLVEYYLSEGLLTMTVTGKKHNSPKLVSLTRLLELMDSYTV